METCDGGRESGNVGNPSPCVCDGDTRVHPASQPGRGARLVREGLGTLAENDKAFIFLMDYAQPQRLKVWGRARVVEDDPELMAQLVDPDYKGYPERAIVFTVEAWDANCPQHIRPRDTAARMPKPSWRCGVALTRSRPKTVPCVSR